VESILQDIARSLSAIALDLSYIRMSGIDVQLVGDDSNELTSIRESLSKIADKYDGTQD
jgi:hypothetical protein